MWKNPEAVIVDLESMTLSIFFSSVQCTLYDDLRQVLKHDIMEVWEEREDRGSLNLSVQLLLFPFANDQLTYVECHDILSATFNYIKNSRRQL